MDAPRLRGLGWLERLWQDVRYGCRTLAGSPGFTLVAVGSLALGIGANSAAFSWADALLLRPLTVARPGEVVTVGSTMSVEGFSSISASYPDYIDIRDRGTSFDGLVAFTGITSGLATSRDALPALRLGLLVSGNFFSVMGVEPALGRAFRQEENAVPGRDAVVIISHTLWKQQFASDRSILGRHLQLSGIEFTIVGVAPEQFTGMNQFVRSDFYVPLMMWPRLLTDPNARPLEDRRYRSLTLKGRLKPGVSMSEAQNELSVIAKNLERAYPDTNRNRDLVVRTELQTRIAQSPPDSMLIAMLTTLALAVLFVACANVAGLLTSRAPARAREMAMRIAIGAGRARLIRQLMTESVLIALAGGLLGLAVGYGAITAFRQIQIPTDLPVRTHVSARSAGAGVQSHRRRAELGPVRSCACDSDVARRSDPDSEERRVDDGPAAALGTQRPGLRPGGRLGRVAGARHVHVPRLSPAAEHRPGVPARIICC